MRATTAIAVAALLLLAGCASEPEAPSHYEPKPIVTADPAPTPEQDVTETPTPTPQPAAELIEVDPATFPNALGQYYGPGIDFDSADHNIRCGIWSEYPVWDGAAASPGAYAGCRPLEADYDTPQRFEDISCSGGQLVSNKHIVEPVCDSGLAFGGEDPAYFGPAGVIAPGQFVAYGGVTCTAPDDGTIECIRDTDGLGFTIGRDSYRYIG